ncbi:hypothetical protein M885DRAFT_532731 [Pelagophyceae sp. CCMP2097]|nr:hypothetical protein M885DRAFT_532731 [Pelagophyceae sp. CCMP2097]
MFTTVALLTLAAARALIAPPIEQVAWLRARESADSVFLETCSRRYECVDAAEAQDESLVGMAVDLTAVVHLAEPEYWEGLGCAGAVLYESIVPRALVDGKSRALIGPISATPDARRAAANCALSAQGDALGGRAFAEKWVIADVAGEDLGRGSVESPLVEGLRLAALGRSGGRMGLQLVCALSPAPELSLSLIDWSASSPRGGVVDLRALRVVAAALAKRDAAALARLSLLRALLGDVDLRASRGPDASIRLRNDRVVAELLRAARGGATEATVIYGAAHMRDLDAQLRRLGFRRAAATDAWRAAFDVPRSDRVGRAALALAAFVVADAVDYIVTLLEAAESPIADGFTLVAAYALRHAALYYALTKFVVS